MPLPEGYIQIATEGQTIDFTGYVDVAYGVGDNYAYLNNVTGNVTFSNTTFGDPAPGQTKYGYYKLSIRYSVMVNIIENLPIENFNILVLDNLNNLIKSQDVTTNNGNNNIEIILSSLYDYVNIMVKPIIKKWKPCIYYDLNDIIIANNPFINPYFYKRVIAGTAGSIEPIWNNNISAITNDNSIAAWECISLTINPITNSYIIPKLKE